VDLEVVGGLVSKENTVVSIAVLRLVVCGDVFIGVVDGIGVDGVVIGTGMCSVNLNAPLYLKERYTNSIVAQTCSKYDLFCNHKYE